MHKVIFTDRALDVIDRYSLKYREYFEELYSDTGIWSESEIRDYYRRESLQRMNEIIDLITQKLSEESVLGRSSDDIIGISWRSKILLVSWYEVGDTRMITDLSIR